MYFCLKFQDLFAMTQSYSRTVYTIYMSDQGESMDFQPELKGQDNEINQIIMNIECVIFKNKLSLSLAYNIIRIMQAR